MSLQASESAKAIESLSLRQICINPCLFRGFLHLEEVACRTANRAIEASKCASRTNFFGSFSGLVPARGDRHRAKNFLTCLNISIILEI